MRLLRVVLAASLGTLAGCAGGGGLPEVEGPAPDTLDLEAGEFYYEPERIAVAAGEVPVVLRNVGLVIR